MQDLSVFFMFQPPARGPEGSLQSIKHPSPVSTSCLQRECPVDPSLLECWQQLQRVHAEFLRRGMGPATGVAPFTEALLQARRLSGQSACCRLCQTQCLPTARAASFAYRARQHQRRWTRARRRQVKHATVAAFSSGLPGEPLFADQTYVPSSACLVHAARAPVLASNRVHKPSTYSPQCMQRAPAACPLLS